ncbi:Exodeoxyribonuclease VII small subunit [Lachnospiraceae bacterium XPB1003]|nr:Exodeoxyribonuclease VII small subunit [Lachnospiraceae bacterium XPB1003]
MAKTAEKTKKPSLEENFEALEETLKKMEDADLPLEEAFALYEDGIKRLKSCGDELDMVEKKVKELADDGSLSDFDGEDE